MLRFTSFCATLACTTPAPPRPHRPSLPSAPLPPSPPTLLQYSDLTPPSTPPAAAHLIRRPPAPSSSVLRRRPSNSRSITTFQTSSPIGAAYIRPPQLPQPPIPNTTSDAPPPPPIPAMDHFVREDDGAKWRRTNGVVRVDRVPRDSQYLPHQSRGGSRGYGAGWPRADIPPPSFVVA